MIKCAASSLSAHRYFQIQVMDYIKGSCQTHLTVVSSVDKRILSILVLCTWKYITTKNYYTVLKFVVTVVDQLITKQSQLS